MSMVLIRKWGLTALSLLLVALIGLVLVKREELLRLMTVTTLFDEDRIVENFSNMGTHFRWALIPRGDSPASALPEGTQIDLPPAVEDWIDARDVTSLLVMKEGEIRFEDYFRGTTRDERRIGWSMSKSLLSALFGVIVAEGKIASLDDPVTKYEPRLAESAYDGVTIRQILTMTSGISFDENYQDFYSDINRMGRVLALGRSMDAFALQRDMRFAEPGAEFQYTSIDTHVLGMVLRGATGRSLPELMSEKIIAPLGLELTPFYITDGHGVAFALGGLNLTTRDFARFGQMMLQRGFWNGTQVVPEDWIEQSTRKQAPTEPGELGYGFQWWLPANGVPGEYMARGIYGQYIYVNEERESVIVVTAADRLFNEDGAIEQNVAIFRVLSEEL